VHRGHIPECIGGCARAGGHSGGERTPRPKGAASKGEQEEGGEEKQQRRSGEFEEVMEEEGRAVTGYGIPA